MQSQAQRRAINERLSLELGLRPVAMSELTDELAVLLPTVL
jgi:hypothetical protein